MKIALLICLTLSTIQANALIYCETVIRSGSGNGNGMPLFSVVINEATPEQSHDMVIVRRGSTIIANSSCEFSIGKDKYTCGDLTISMATQGNLRIGDFYFQKDGLGIDGLICTK